MHIPWSCIRPRPCRSPCPWAYLLDILSARPACLEAMSIAVASKHSVLPANRLFAQLKVWALRVTDPLLAQAKVVLAAFLALLALQLRPCRLLPLAAHFCPRPHCTIPPEGLRLSLAICSSRARTTKTSPMAARMKNCVGRLPTKSSIAL